MLFSCASNSWKMKWRNKSPLSPERAFQLYSALYQLNSNLSNSVLFFGRPQFRLRFFNTRIDCLLFGIGILNSCLATFTNKLCSRTDLMRYRILWARCLTDSMRYRILLVRERIDFMRYRTLWPRCLTNSVRYRILLMRERILWPWNGTHTVDSAGWRLIYYVLWDVLRWNINLDFQSSNCF